MYTPCFQILSIPSSLLSHTVASICRWLTQAPTNIVYPCSHNRVANVPVYWKSIVSFLKSQHDGAVYCNHFVNFKNLSNLRFCMPPKWAKTQSPCHLCDPVHAEQWRTATMLDTARVVAADACRGDAVPLCRFLKA